MTLEIFFGALLIGIPVAIKYFLAFETRGLVDQLKNQEREVRSLGAQLEALEQEHLVVRRAMRQVESQRRRAEVRRGVVEEELARMRQG